MEVTGTYILNEALNILSEFNVTSDDIDSDTYEGDGLTALNLIRRELLEELEEIEKTYTLSTVSGQASYDISTLEPGLTFDGILKDEVVFTETGTPLKFAISKDVAQNVIPNQGAQYQRFYKGKDTTGKELFNLYPIPDEDDVEITIPYEVQLVDDITAETIDDVIEAPARHLNAWILGVAMWIAIKDEREMATQLENRYERAKAVLVAKSYAPKYKNRLEPSKHWQNILKNGR